MKLSTCLVTLCLGLGVVSEPLSFGKRALADFTDALTFINDQVVVLRGLAEGYTGGPADNIVAASEEVVKRIEDTMPVLTGLPELDWGDSLGLAGFVGPILDNVNQTILTFIDKKQIAIDNDMAYIVKTQFDLQYDAAAQLGDLLVLKTNERVKPTARNLANALLRDIQRGIDAYADITAPTTTETEGPTNTATEGPTDTATEGPTDTATEGPTDTATEGPTDTATEGPTDTATEGPTGTATESPTDTATEGPTDTATEGPTGTATEGPTDTATGGPTGTPTDGPTGGPTDTGAPPEPTDSCGPGRTVTETVTVTECGPGEPTGGNPPPGSTRSHTVPYPPAPTPTGPPPFEGASSVNKVGSLGAFAAVAVVLAL